MPILNSTSNVKNFHFLHIFVYTWIWYCQLFKFFLWTVWWELNSILPMFWYTFLSLLWGCVVYWPSRFPLLWIACSCISLFFYCVICLLKIYRNYRNCLCSLDTKISLAMCCKWFLLIFSVNFKMTFTEVLRHIVAYIYLCFFWLGIFAFHL